MMMMKKMVKMMTRQGKKKDGDSDIRKEIKKKMVEKKKMKGVKAKMKIMEMVNVEDYIKPSHIISPLTANPPLHDRFRALSLFTECLFYFLLFLLFVLCLLKY